jgi:hypothetical protein
VEIFVKDIFYEILYSYAIGPARFLLYHSDGCNIRGTEFQSVMPVTGALEHAVVC